MTKTVYRYYFDDHDDFEEAELFLDMAFIVAECLHGEVLVRHSARYFGNPKKLGIVVAASDEIGECIARVLTGLLIRGLGEENFRVDRVQRNRKQDEVAA